MKRSIIFLFLLAFTLAGFSQGLLKRVPADLFERPSEIKGLTFSATSNTVFIPRLNTGVIGYSFGKDYGPEEFGAVGFGLGLLRYKDDNGVPFNDIGINALFLKNTANNGIGLGAYITYNIKDAFSLLNAGCHYDFYIDKFLIDFGLTWHY